MSKKNQRQGKDYLTMKDDILYTNIRKLVVEAIGSENLTTLHRELIENIVRLQTLVRRIRTELEYQDLYIISDSNLIKKNPMLGELKSLTSEVRNHLDTLHK